MLKKGKLEIFLVTVTDWDSMGRVVTQTRGRAYQTLGSVFQTLGRAFDFLLSLQKLGRVFGKLGQVCFKARTRPSV